MILNHVFDIRAVFLWWEYGPRQAPFFPIKVIFLSCGFWHAYELGGHIFSNNILYLNFLACIFRKRWPPSLHADHSPYVREGIIPNASYTHADCLVLRASLRLRTWVATCITRKGILCITELIEEILQIFIIWRP